MNRIGIGYDNPQKIASKIRNLSDKLEINGILTHLCVADSMDESDKIFTRLQLERFKAIADEIAGMNLPYIHC